MTMKTNFTILLFLLSCLCVLQLFVTETNALVVDAKEIVDEFADETWNEGDEDDVDEVRFQFHCDNEIHAYHVTLHLLERL